MTEPTWFRVDGDEVCLLRDGKEAFPAMLAAIAAAEREVLLEMYWVSPDAVGLRFLDALAARARAGVRVRVIYDAIGSISITPGFWAALARAGGEIVPFHTIFPHSQHAHARRARATRSPQDARRRSESSASSAAST